MAKFKTIRAGKKALKILNELISRKQRNIGDFRSFKKFSGKSISIKSFALHRRGPSTEPISKAKFLSSDHIRSDLQGGIPLLKANKAKRKLDSITLQRLKKAKNKQKLSRSQKALAAFTAKKRVNQKVNLRAKGFKFVFIRGRVVPIRIRKQ